MVDITLFELHLDGAEFTANAPFSSADENESESTSRWRRRSKSRSGDDSESEIETDAGSGGAKRGLLALFAVGALAVVAIALVRSLGGDEDGEADEP